MEDSSRFEQRAYRPVIQWFEVLAGPLVWSVHFLIVYFAVEFACGLGFFEAPILGLPLLIWVVILATVIAVGLLAWAAVAAFRDWRTVRREDRGVAEAVILPGRIIEGRSEFMTLAAAVLSLFFAGVVLITALPALFLQPCPWN